MEFFEDGLADVLKRSYEYTKMITLAKDRTIQAKWNNKDEDIYKLLVKSNIIKSYNRCQKTEWVSGNPCDAEIEYIDDVIFNI